MDLAPQLATRLPRTRRARASALPYRALALGAVGAAMWVLSQALGPSRAGAAVAELAFPVVGTGVAALAWRARRMVHEPRARQGWALFSAAVAAQALADLAWLWLDVVEQTQPFPSVADVGYVASYGLMLAGIWRLGTTRRSLDRTALLLDLAIVATGSLMLVWHLVLQEVLATTGPLAQQVLAVGYPVSDSLLVTAAAALVIRRPPWMSAHTVVALACGLVAWTAADITWTYWALGDGYGGGSWLDLVWLGAMACWGVAAEVTRHPVERVRHSRPRPRGDQILPLTGLALGYGVLASLVSDVPFHSSGILVALGVALSTLALARQATVRREHAELLERYHQLATVDALTGLMRREAWLEAAELELAATQAASSPMVVLMVDLDNFKRINDRHGHAGGDAVLVAVAQACRQAAGADTAVGRFGGDEIVAVVPGVDHHGGAELAQRIVDGLAARPVLIGGVAVVVTLSVGITDTVGREPLVAVLARADVALYDAKAAGRGRAVVYQGSSRGAERA